MIAGANYWLLTSLPTLDGPDTPPPFSPVELRARAAGSDGARLVDVILLSEDLRQRQAIQAGEPVHSEAAVLTPAQLSGNDPLPASLRPAEPIPVGALPEELVWQAYWAYAAAVARRRRSRFLGAWAHT
ncbi:MAG: hypothetical protein LJF04_00845, partial [Gemmatimonadetes bacterium]|nr:hypothetical protein [Gemmatimonadota bacterium]